MTVADLERRTKQHYGWLRDIPDQRDLTMGVPNEVQVLRLPSQASLRSLEPEPCYDQGQLGSCTANGCAFVWQYTAKQQGLAAKRPSRLFIYWYERWIEGTVSSDSGAMIRDGMKVLAHNGAPPEDLWPYDIAKFADTPSQAAIDAGEKDLAITYLRCVRSLYTFKHCIVRKLPIVFGFSVYESFESASVAQTGLMPMPAKGEALLGGHCTVVVGYDDNKQLPGGIVGAFEVRNSWGPSWGDAGHFWMPYGYINNPGLSSDFWTVRAVEEGASAMHTILVVLLILSFFSGGWGYSRYGYWGFSPTAILVILLILVLLGAVHI